jgi:hypothetical protein
MTRLYVPPALKSKQYLNLATINGMDIGLGTPIYGSGTPVRDWTTKNDLSFIKASEADVIPSPDTGYALDFYNFGTKFSFQMSDPAVIFFEILSIFNPPNTTYQWASGYGESLVLFLYDANQTASYGASLVRYPMVSIGNKCGPFVSEISYQVPVGETNLYVCGYYKNGLDTQTGFRQISVRVNLWGFLL